ncbi:uncharacterized protein LY89DRAFT_598914, partial [Mollisia scopiformis]
NYTAISYTWGDASLLKMIWINGVPLEITTNLFEALLHVRDTKRQLRIWADAICINQHDDEEKSFQVGMMGRIYATAHHTVIYVGLEPTSALSRTFRQYYPSEREAQQIAQKPWFGRLWCCKSWYCPRILGFSAALSVGNGTITFMLSKI